jgi:hypothetical protein
MGISLLKSACVYVSPRNKLDGEVAWNARRRKFSYVCEPKHAIASLVGALCYKTEGRGFDIRLSKLFCFSIHLIPPAALGPGVYSASSRSKYQKHQQQQQQNIPLSLSAAGAYDWQYQHHLWVDCLDNMLSPIFHNPVGLHGQIWRWLLLVIRTPHYNFNISC